MWGEREKERVKMMLRVLVWVNGKNGMGEIVGGVGFRVKIWSLILDVLNLRCLFGYLGRNVNRELDIWMWSWGGKFRLEMDNFEFSVLRWYFIVIRLDKCNEESVSR